MTALVFGFQLTAFTLSLSAAPDAGTAVAVAVGLVRADGAPDDVPASVQVTRPGPSASAGLLSPEGERIEWVRMCDENGCRLVRRNVPVEAPQTASRAPQGSAALSTSVGPSSISCDNGHCRQGKRRFFRKRW